MERRVPAVSYITWTNDALAAEAARLRKVEAPSMADRGTLSAVEKEIRRRAHSEVEPRAGDSMASGYWLEHAEGPEGRGSADTVTGKPNRVLMVYRRWLGKEGSISALGYDVHGWWKAEWDRRATVAKNRALVMSRIQRQEFQHFERSYAQRVVAAMSPEAAGRREDRDIWQAAGVVAAEAASDVRRLVFDSAGRVFPEMAGVAKTWDKCTADGRNLHDDLHRAIRDVTRKWVLARLCSRGQWLVARRPPRVGDEGMLAAVRAAAALRAGR